MLLHGRERIICRRSHLPGVAPRLPPPTRSVTDVLFLLSVSVRNTPAAEYDKNTWAPLADLAQNHPEAGVHFQGSFTLSFP
jgi:hypothetical protein